MAERVEPLDLRVTWEPNDPQAVLLSDDSGRAALAQRAHFDDPDQRCVVLRWNGVLAAQMGAPNDEARHHHPLYELGLKGLLWAGVVHDSWWVDRASELWSRTTADESGQAIRVLPLHYVILSKECVVEVLAENVDVYRIPGTPTEAATASLS